MLRTCSECNMPTTGESRCVVCYCEKYKLRRCNRCNAELVSVGICSCGCPEFRIEESIVSSATADAPKRARRPRKLGDVAKERVDELDDDVEKEEKPKRRPRREQAEKVPKSKKPSDKVTKARALGDANTFPCQFGGVSIGDMTGRISLKIAKNRINVSTAEKLFCGRRVNCRLVARPVDEDPDQQHFDGMETKIAMEAVVDVKRFASDPHNISIGVTCSLQEVDVTELSRFAKKFGQITVIDSQSLDEIGADE